MKDLVQRLRTFTTIMTTSLALDGYRRSVLNDDATQKFLDASENLVKQHKSLELLRLKVQISLDKANILDVKTVGVKGRISEYMDQLLKNFKKIEELATDPEKNQKQIDTITRDSLVIFNRASIEIEDLSVSAHTEEIDLTKTLQSIADSDTKAEFMGISDITSFFSELSTAQLGAIGHILAALAIYYCVMTILGAYYGDKLITYFNLETRYPRLAR